MSDHERSADHNRDSTPMDTLKPLETSGSSPLRASPTLRYLPGDHWRLPDQLAEPSRIKPPTSQCLENQVYAIDKTGLYFQNEIEAQRSMSNYQWRAPANDASIPHTEKEDRWVVAQIVYAIKNMSQAKDTLGSAYLRRFKAPRHYYEDWAIEACAWDVLAIAKQIHVEGFNYRLYDAALIDTIGETQYWHFEDRIGWICLALRTSKNVAVNLLKKEKVMTIVGAPHKLHKATLINTRSNANRAVWVQNGRDADVEHRDRPFTKRTDHNGTPMPLPKRIRKEAEAAGRVPDNSMKEANGNGNCRSTPNASSSPPALSPPTLASRPENGTSLSNVHNDGYAIPDSHPIYPPVDFNITTNQPLAHGGVRTTIATLARGNNGDEDVDMAETPYPPLTCFSLDAINYRINYKRPTFKDEVAVHVGLKSEASSGVCRSSPPDDRDTGDSPSITMRFRTEREDNPSCGDAAGGGIANVFNATPGIAAATSCSTSASIVKTQNIVEMHDASDIDAAHVLTSMQQGFAL